MFKSSTTRRLARRAAVAVIATATTAVGLSTGAAALTVGNGGMTASTQPGTIQPLTFTSYISDWDIGHTSRHWKDNHYTQIHFRGCSLQSRPHKYWKSFNIQLRDDISWAPDKSFGTHRGKACFHGDKVTTMHWSHDNWGGSGDKRYFKLTAINGATVGTYQRFNSSHVVVDTTKKD